LNRPSTPTIASQSKTSKPAPAQAQNQAESSHSPAEQRKTTSKSWRIVGVLQTGECYFVAMSNPSGRVRLESPAFFRDKGIYMAGIIDGEIVTVWSGLLMEKGSDMPKVPDIIK
jgi:zona occludens toxin